jgi:acyl dehydratase
MSEELAPRTYRVTRADLLAYAAASGDHNPIHSDEDVARSVGLPGVIAHGMYTLALAARYVDESVGSSGRIVELAAKFTKPVVVPAGDEGAEVTVAGVLEVRDGIESIALTVTCGADKVLGNPRAVLRA